MVAQEYEFRLVSTKVLILQTSIYTVHISFQLATLHFHTRLWMALLTFRVVLSTSINPVKELALRHVQMLVSHEAEKWH